MKSKKPKWVAGKTAAANARAVLPSLAEEFFAAGRVAAATRATPEELHGFRLVAKRFRYTLEVFRPIYGPGLDKRLDQLRKVQQKLGEINDCAVSAALIAGGEPARSPEARKVLAFVKARLRQRKTDFHRFWREIFDAPGALEQWSRYLARYAGRVRKAAHPAASAQAAHPASPAAAGNPQPAVLESPEQPDSPVLE